jgi:ABC-type branched-subunit amino acid transport system substrate-binding protein
VPLPLAPHRGTGALEPVSRARIFAGAIAIASAVVIVLGLLVGLDRGHEPRSASSTPGTTTPSPTAPSFVPPTPGAATPSSTTATVPTTAAPPIAKGTVVINPAPAGPAPATTAPATTAPATTAPATTAPAIAPATTPPVAATGPTTTTIQTATTTRPPSRSANTPGVTKHALEIAVIADGTAAPGMRAWASTINARGGIAGRTVKLDVLTVAKDPARYRSAVATACSRDFAIVGSNSVAGDGGVTAASCGIPNLPVHSTWSAEGTTTYPVMPTDPESSLVGGIGWLVDHVEGCCRGVALVPSARRLEGTERINAARVVGYDAVGSVTAPPVPAQVVATVRIHNADVVWSMMSGASTVSLREQLPATSSGNLTWFCTASCYSGSFLTDGGATVEGQYVELEVNPFEDAASVPGLRNYLRASSSKGATPSVGSVEEFAAGLLLEDAIGPDTGRTDLPSRSEVLTALANIHDFDADGILGPTDIGLRRPNGCYVLLQIRDARYERVQPTTPGTLACGAGNLKPVTAELGTAGRSQSRS